MTLAGVKQHAALAATLAELRRGRTAQEAGGSNGPLTTQLRPECLAS